MLTSQSVAWITTFAETGGIESILQGLNAVSVKKKYAFPVFVKCFDINIACSKTEEDYYTILEYISCITIMIGVCVN